jgi:hypothetical protein
MMMLLPADINAFTFNSFNIPSPIIEKLSHDTSTIKKTFDSGALLNVIPTEFARWIHSTSFRQYFQESSQTLH